MIYLRTQLFAILDDARPDVPSVLHEIICDFAEPKHSRIAIGSTIFATLQSNGSIRILWYNRHIPIPRILKDNKFISISAGESHLMALKSDGSIVCWSRDNIICFIAPEGNDFVAISAGWYHSCALKSDGSIVSWGRDEYGQVSETPTESDFTAVSAGKYSSSALRTDDTVSIWGVERRLTVSEGPEITQISMGHGIISILRVDGSIDSYGNDENNQVSGTPKRTGF